MLFIKRIYKFTFLYAAFIIFVLKLNFNNFLKLIIDYRKFNNININKKIWSVAKMFHKLNLPPELFNFLRSL